MKNRFLVTADWDDEARVWVATSEDLPGLATEAPTLDALIQRVCAVAPELLEDNRHLIGDESSTKSSVEVCVLRKFQLDAVNAH